jgi:ABC-type branched-subunit amino acid transport system substrate-binding protein
VPGFLLVTLLVSAGVLVSRGDFGPHPNIPFAADKAQADIRFYGSQTFGVVRGQVRYCRPAGNASKMPSPGRETAMKNRHTRREFGATALATIATSILPAPYVWAAEKKYDPGASDTEIKLGRTVPHSGPGSLYGVLGRVGEADFQMLNEKGGLNGRKVMFLTMDDAYSAAKCVEATRRLVEQEEVLALFGSLGTAPRTAVHKYLNSKGVPQLLLNTGASKWNDPKNFKWTMAGLPLYPTEARILAKHVLSVKPEAKVGILYQNDDFGRDFLGPFKKVLADAGGKAQVIMEQTYDLTDPTIDSQLINLSKSSADVFYNISTGKASSQSIRKAAELGWKPLPLLSAGSTLTVLPGFFELQSQHPKIPFPATEFRDGTGTSRRSEIVRREASSERFRS